MKRVLWVMLFISISVQAKTVSIGIHEYPPYYGKDKKGLLIDVYNELFKRVGLETEFLMIPIQRCPLLMMKGKVDFCSPGKIFLIPEQIKKSVYTQIVNVIVVWVKKKSDLKEFKYKSIGEMKDYKLGIIKNSPFKVIYAQAKLDYIEVETYQQLVDLYMAKRIDFFESTLLSANTYSIKNNIAFDTYIWNKIPAGLATNKTIEENAQLMSKLALEFKNMIKDKSFENILKNYWSDRKIPKEVFID